MSNDALFPEADPFESGFVNVSENPHHRLYYEQYGNPHGEPVLFVHGGPGGPAGPEAARFFDPARFRVINYHQRGCGKSEPFLSLEQNTTRTQLEDIERLRRALGVTDRMHVFGGSWGSFLSLVYALAFPNAVASLTLRGIFLGRGVDLYDAYQKDAQSVRGGYSGAARIFPEAWEAFVGYIPRPERCRLLEAYYQRIHASGPEQLEAARHWYAWEDAILRLHPQSAEEARAALDKTDDVLCQAIMETHYFRNRCFLSEFGGDNFILTNLDHIARIPVTIAQGLYDQCTPRCMADELVAALNAARTVRGLAPVRYDLTVAGHTMMDPENQAALVRATNALPVLEEALA
jgi:proline iminopeptidase